MAQRLIKGGTVLSMDSTIGDLPRADVLIEDDKIVAVEPDISADAEVIDAPATSSSRASSTPTGTPGRRRSGAARPTRRSTTTSSRCSTPSRPVYRARGRPREQRRRIARVPQRRHHDTGRLVAHQQHAGPPRRRHPGLQATGSAPSTPTAAPTPRWPTTGSRARSRSRPTTYAASATPTSPPTAACSRWASPPADRLLPGGGRASEWELARELGIPITVHVAMGRLAGRFGMIKQLSDLGLLGPDTTYIHCCHFSDEEWQLVKDSGGTISIAPQVETQMGHGWPPFLKSTRAGGCVRACRSTS